MLTALHLSNFLIVQSLELDLQAGMTAFTGETGAGKSIMIDALLLAMGGRADASVVRTGELKCVINAAFEISINSEPAQWLKAHEIECEEGEVQLRRVISAEGRSKSYLNGQLLPLQKIREFSHFLVHIHGQHESQNLLKPATHRQQLDRFAQHECLTRKMQQCYHAWQETRQSLDKLGQSTTASDGLELLQFQISELEQLDLQPGELQSLDQEHPLLQNAKDYLERSHAILERLNNEESFAVSQGLHHALQILQSLPQTNTSIISVSEMLNNALIQCEEASVELKNFTQAVSLDPERLQAIEHRLSELHQAARKYKVAPEQLVEKLQSFQAQLEALRENDKQRETLLATLRSQEASCVQAAQKLRTSREQAAKNLASNISDIIQKLGMPKGYVTIHFSPLEIFQEHGMDKVEYQVCTNPGTPAASLGKIASGGELSRISLAIEMITAQQGTTPTLMFDEVDVGVGGATAALVGKLLRRLGDRLQVFCVTHQPQVAACAHQHLRVEKELQENQTFSNVRVLDETQRTEEIARMLGGITVSEQTRSFAKEMLLESR